MNIFFIILVWLIMGGVLASGVVMAVHGTFWLLIVGLVGFVLALIKYGIFSH